MGVTSSQASKKSYITSTNKQLDEENLIKFSFLFFSEARARDWATPSHSTWCSFFYLSFICEEENLKHIYNWTQQWDWNWTGTANLFWVFGKHFAGFFFLVLHQHFISPCNFNALNEKCIISHTSWKKQKKTQKHPSA